MKSQPPLRLATFCVEASRALQGVVVDCRIFPGEAKAHMANAKLELGDALTQLNMLCLDMELVPEEILKLGIQHTYERFQDFAERGWDKRQ